MIVVNKYHVHMNKVDKLKVIMEQLEQYISVYEAASMLGVHVNTVRNYIRAGKEGKLPNTFKKGYIVLVHIDDVQALLDGKDEVVNESEKEEGAQEAPSEPKELPDPEV